MIQIKSVGSPFADPALARLAVSVIERAEAMGLLPPDHTIDVLDLPAFKKVAQHLGRAGIAQGLLRGIARDAPAPPQLEEILVRIGDVLEHSPVPQREWGRLLGPFGADWLGELLGVSPSSVRRYAARGRVTPDAVAARLHFLALVVGELAGAYNEVGVRRWFERKRSQLGGRAPRDLLRGDWDPNDPEPTQVRNLARALLFAAAT